MALTKISGDVVQTPLNVGDINCAGVSTFSTLQVGTGGTIITTTSDGNIGIGITNPLHTLDVNGSIGFGTGTVDGLLRSWSATDTDINNLLPGSTFGSIIEGADSAHIVIAIRDNDVNDSLSIISGGGNYQTDSTYDTLIAYFKSNGLVGIGTNVPAGQLNVRTGPVIVGSGSSTGTTSQTLQVTGGAYVSDSVGIGTTNPTSKLTVQGDTNINNTLPTTVSYASSFSVATQETAPHDVFFSNDGKTMYFLGDNGNDITWYTLSTPWDINTSVHVSQFSVAGQLTVPLGLYFKPDGTKFYVVGTTGVGAAATAVNQYSCGTPWDLTTASYDSVSYNVYEKDINPHGVEFKPDGTRMYVLGNTTDSIYQYSLSTPWDVSTVSYGSSFRTVNQENSPTGIRFSLDGTKLLLIGASGDDINYYTLKTPWDITTTSFVGIITSVGAGTLGETNSSGLYWKPDGTKLYTTGTTLDRVYEFNMTSDADLEVTGKTSLYGQLDVYENINFYSELNSYGVSTFSGGIQVGATTSIVVGSSFIKDNSIGLGQTTTTGRNAGVGTAAGTLIFNSTLNQLQVYNGNRWTNAGETFIEATGGTISDYTESGTVYRAHVFTSSGTFSVTSAPVTSNTVEYLVVAGGGGGSSHGGGGAGGFRTGIGFTVSATPGSYTVTVGGGGNSASSTGSNGNNSVFSTITSTGGGGGSINAGQNGGSGGGGGGSGSTYPGGTGNSPPTSPSQGNPGGSGLVQPDFDLGGGGGGAGGSGGNPEGSGPDRGGSGGAGSTSSITGISSTYAGGGGGVSGTPAPAPSTGGTGGGGAGGKTPGSPAAVAGTYSTGGGGGGASGGAGGGSGIVVVRYVIGNLTATAKATGGLISYANNKTIHTFLSSGTFTVTNPGLTSVEYLVVGGGGGGGSTTGGTSDRPAGGGGAGLLKYSSDSPVSSTPGIYTITIGAGGKGARGDVQGGDGDSSSFGPITSPGGGGGACNTSRTGRSGGSGGGGTGGNSGGAGSGASGGTPGTASPASGWGNPGGSSVDAAAGASGGGGGAGAAGGNGSPPTTAGTAGNGGSGLSYSISGISTHYAGGGGGSANNGTAGSGGLGGGGAGSNPDNGTSGTVATGGGGGAGGASAPGKNGGSGGSGVVIIAYPS